MSRAVWLWLLVIAGEAVAAAALRKLPVWLEESHAGSFYFFAATLPLDEPVTLVLVDAHSDASGKFDSDDERQAIRRGPVEEARAALFRTWRERGRIQCHNWIEPLMPLPFHRVMWVAGPELSQSELSLRTTRARDELDGLAEASARDGGLLGPRYQAWDLRGFEEEAAHWPESEPVAVSIDLDFFAAVPDNELEEVFDRVMDTVLELRGLRALSFCISSPWLKSPEQAERLVALTLDRLFLTSGIALHFEPWAACGPDHSEMAKELAKRGRTPPAFDLAKAGPELRSLLLPAWRPEMTEFEPQKREAMLKEWAADPFLPRLTVPGTLPGADGFYHLAADRLAGKRIVISPEPVGAVVRWQVREALRPAYAMIDGPWDFAKGAQRWPRFRWKTLTDSESALPLSRLQALSPEGGTSLVRAVVVQDGASRPSRPITFRTAAPGTTGFKAALSAQGGLPYLFGSTWLRGADGWDEPASGPETAQGGDCANYLIAAWRAEGWRIPWGSPGELRRKLRKVKEFTPQDVAMGIGIDLGNHCAALWEDREPMGRLNTEDVVSHQLNGPPALVKLGELMPGHAPPEAMRPDLTSETVTLCFGGDVMLGRGVARDFGRSGLNPLESFLLVLTKADWTMVNLEGPVADAPEAAFAAPDKAAFWLKEAGIDAVSLANNHARDAGASGLENTVKVLREAGIRTALAEGPELEVKGLPLSVFAWNDDGEPPPEALLVRISVARQAGRWPLVFAHWGTEHSHRPDERQRGHARRFLDSGARLIVGAGPHTLQRVEDRGQAVVAWSLGNLVFDGPGPDADWRRGGLLLVSVDPRDGRILRRQLVEIPVAGTKPPADGK